MQRVELRINSGGRRGERLGEHRDAAALEQHLRRQVRGEVFSDDGNRALYATDASNYRQVPIGVVRPVDADDVVAAMAACRDHGAPVLSRGAGTSVAGQSCNVAVILDTSKHVNQILDINPVGRTARVQPGVICDHLVWAAEKYGLTYGTGPATHQWCTLGGMLGNNACGKYSVLHGPPERGRTSDTVQEMEVLTYDGLRLRVGPTEEGELERIIQQGGRRGEIYRRLRDLRDRYGELIRRRMPEIPRRVSGYNLDELLPENGFNVARALVGTEGTCVSILEATLGLAEDPPRRVMVILAYPDVFAAGDDSMRVIAHRPTALEGLDAWFIANLRKKELHADKLPLLPEGAGGYLIAEFGGETREAAAEAAQEMIADLRESEHRPQSVLIEDARQQKNIWTVREAGLGATAHVPGEKENHEGWEDAAVHPEQLGDYLRDFRALLKRRGIKGNLYGHFGQGCIHTRLSFELKTAEGIEQFRAFLEDASDLVVKYGGSYSGEHGDGQSKAYFLPKLYGPELVEAFEEFKSIWDPHWRMNPGKVVRPFAPTENLRFGADYAPPEPATHFRMPDDDGSWANAMERCVGVGKCRKEEADTMCPSYMVTREERHSTRGRARLLFEMLRGETIRDGWRSEAVHEALDLCLSCKACKGECPVNVDMATYKAEFTSHYYAGRPRPRRAYAFGFIHQWARLASLAPTLANAASQLPILRDALKAVADVAPQRRMPAFAPQTFKQWFARRRGGRSTGEPVVLWADTFTNAFAPEIGRDAVAVLENAGFRVLVPQRDYCCGRPLYEFGLLTTARRWLRDILDGLAGEIRAGTPFIVLEPSCAAVFRDELIGLLPHDQDAHRLQQQTFTLGEFLSRHAPNYQSPALHGRAMLHPHCHHKALMSLEGETQMLDRTGLDVEQPDSGCCGMAGAFGFESDKYDVSIACGERVLLPTVREADPHTVIVADGFSCREQIAQTTDRRALHLAQVLRLTPQAIEVEPHPEVPSLRQRRQAQRQAVGRTAIAAVAGLSLAGLAVWALRGAGSRE